MAQTMDGRERRLLRSAVLGVRAVLEGQRDAGGCWQPGDFAQRLAALGVRRNGPLVPVTELGPLTSEDRRARTWAEQALRSETEKVEPSATIDALVAEAAYHWTNRLLALRCLEARELIDEVIVRRSLYGGRSLTHHRLARCAPERCAGDDDGLYAVLTDAFAAQAARLPLLFDPDASAVALRPSPAALSRCLDILSGRGGEPADEAVLDRAFRAPEALGWAYQYYHASERAHVLERLRTDRGAKIDAAGIIPATQLYTEPYMVEFLVHNTLGAVWSAMHPDSPLAAGWRSLVPEARRPRVSPKPVEQITVLDPACGSGHFLLCAFDLLYGMYEEQGSPVGAEEICRSILERNLFGIDLDPRAVQIAEAALWMKAAERCGPLAGFSCNLVATRAAFSSQHRVAAQAVAARRVEERTVETAAASAAVLASDLRAFEHADELGSLLRVVPVASTPRRGVTEGESVVSSPGAPAERLLAWLGQRYDVVVANPPYVDKRHQGPVLRAHLRAHYGAAKGNTFAAFMLRALELGECAIGMVTPQTFLFVRSYERLREQLTDRAALVLLAQLGAGAFQDAGVDPAMFVLHPEANATARLQTEVVCFDLTDIRDKAAALAEAVRPEPSNSGDPAPPRAAGQRRSESARSSGQGRRFVRSVAQLRSIPGHPFAYRLGVGSLACFEQLPPLGASAAVVLGMKTSDNHRFVRWWWELGESPQRCRGLGWVPYEKRASGCRYGGGSSHWVRWTDAAVDFYRTAYSAQLPNERYWFREAIVYGLVSQHFSAKPLPAGHMTDMAASCVVPHRRALTWPLLGLLNCTLAQWWLRMLNPSVNFQPVDVQRLPVPPWGVRDRRHIARQARRAAAAMDALRSRRLTDRGFRPSPPASADLDSWVSERLLQEIELGARYGLACHAVDQRMAELFGLPADELRAMKNDVGRPAAEYPLLRAHDRPLRGMRLAAAHSRIATPEPERRLLARLTSRQLRTRRAGLGRVREGTLGSAATPLQPVDTRTEALAHELELHPVSVYRLLQRMLVSEGRRWPELERQLAVELLSGLVLQLVGHRWPHDLEVGAASPPWAAPDGVVPLIDTPDGPSALVRLRAGLEACFPRAEPAALERQCAALLGQPLPLWLQTRFFALHLRQFEKRPVVWQLQSRAAGRQAPAFACWIHVHRLDADTLSKVRSQHVRPLRRRLDARLVAPSTATARTSHDAVEQRARRAKLAELDDFDGRLAQVIAHGFASERIGELLATEPRDRWSAVGPEAPPPRDEEAWRRAEQRYVPNPHDGVRVNIAPLQLADLLASPVLPARDLERALADRAEWRAAERHGCREGAQPQPSWW